MAPPSPERDQSQQAPSFSGPAGQPGQGGLAQPGGAAALSGEPSAEAPELERFPALRKLAWRSGKRVPFVQQMEAADCGAASLAMVLAYHGREVRLDEIRQAAGVDRNGSDALALLQAGERYGLQGRGLKLDVGDLRHLQTASILHWEFNHFVVFERIVKGGVQIVDPGFGRRFIPMERFRQSFTGVALSFEPVAGFATTPPGKSRVWSYLRQLLGQRHIIGRVVMTSILMRVFALSLPILTALVVDRVVPRSDKSLLLIVGCGMGGVLLFQMMSRLLRAHLLLQLRTNLDTRMTLGFLDHLVDLPYGFFQRRSSGDLLMRVSSNTTVRDILTSNMLSALLDGSLVSIYLILLFLLSPAIAVLALGLGVLQVSVFILSRRRYRELMSQDLETQARAQSYLVQMLAGIETLKVAGAEHRAVEHWSNLFVDELNVSLQRGRLSAVIEAVNSVLQTGAPLVLLGFGALQVMEGHLTLGSMLAVNALASGFLTPLSSLVDGALQLQQLGSYIERIDDVLSAEVEQQRDKVALPPRLAGKVEVKNVSFRYGPQANYVVREVSLAVEPGTSVAIVGKSGSGKSTLASLLLGLYPPTEGRIYYDEHPLTDLDLRAVRRQLGIVNQAPYIFSGSVRDNIALTDPTLPNDRIIAAARRACIHEDIMAMPMAYNTIVADGGASLSGGQRQRIALARALVRQPAILLLDEATSSLDAKTERAVMESLAAMSCTRVIIAHRLSTIVNADQIIVMHEGRIVEVGNHADLLSRRGAYHDLISAQASLGRGWIA